MLFEEPSCSVTAVHILTAEGQFYTSAKTAFETEEFDPSEWQTFLGSIFLGTPFHDLLWFATDQLNRAVYRHNQSGARKRFGNIVRAFERFKHANVYDLLKAIKSESLYLNYYWSYRNEYRVPISTIYCLDGWNRMVAFDSLEQAARCIGARPVNLSKHIGKTSRYGSFWWARSPDDFDTLMNATAPRGHVYRFRVETSSFHRSPPIVFKNAAAAYRSIVNPSASWDTFLDRLNRLEPFDYHYYSMVNYHPHHPIYRLNAAGNRFLLAGAEDIPKP